MKAFCPKIQLLMLIALLPTSGSLLAFKFNLQNALPHVEELRKFAINTARISLMENGSFRPFAVSLSIKGEYKIEYGKGEDTNADLNMLLEKFREQARNKAIVAVVILYDTRYKPENDPRELDAIYLTSDSKHTESRNAYLLYRKGDDGKFSFGTMFDNKRDQTSIF